LGRRYSRDNLGSGRTSFGRAFVGGASNRTEGTRLHSGAIRSNSFKGKKSAVPLQEGLSEDSNVPRSGALSDQRVADGCTVKGLLERPRLFRGVPSHSELHTGVHQLRRVVSTSRGPVQLF
jgi:hypothetical protein